MSLAIRKPRDAWAALLVSDYYHRVLTINIHNPSNALGRPLALLPPPE